MFLNWQCIAKALREKTATYESLTLFSYFESSTKDHRGTIRILTALLSLFFYSVYISAGLMGLGLLLESLLLIPYPIAIVCGMVIVIPFLLLGGFVTLAWTDLVQGIFLLMVIVLVPLLAYWQLQGDFHPLCTNFWPETALGKTTSLLLFFSWGLGYFGQPHILTKFMGIQNPDEIPKSMLVGMSWQTLTLIAATSIGLLGPQLFPTLENPELLFIEMAKYLLHPLLVGLALSAIIGITITSMGAQILVVVSTMAEDFYKKLFYKEADDQEIVRVTRWSTLLVALIALMIAALKPTNLFDLVSYAWFGLGSSFGPLVIATLCTKNLHRYSAITGIFTGGLMSALFPLLHPLLPFTIPALIPGFISGCLLIFFTEWHCRTYRIPS